MVSIILKILRVKKFSSTSRLASHGLVSNIEGSILSKTMRGRTVSMSYYKHIHCPYCLINELSLCLIEDIGPLLSELMLTNLIMKQAQHFKLNVGVLFAS